MWYNCGMRTIAKNANDFIDLRTADGGNCVYVDKTDYGWKVHPVIHLNFGNCAAATYADFASLLPNVMKLEAAEADEGWVGRTCLRLEDASAG